MRLDDFIGAGAQVLELGQALTAATGPCFDVDPQPTGFPKGRLLDSARRVVGDGRWMNGLCYEPFKCEGGSITDPCIDDTKTLSPNADVVSFSPFEFAAEDTCSSFDAVRAREDRARRVLARCESERLARELWTGEVMTTNPSFDQAGATILTTDAGVAPSDALACLEQALRECGCGSSGMIHATAQVVTNWNENGQLVFDDAGILRTILGTIVVVDSGYPGTPPAGAADAAGVSWAIATDMLTIFMSDVFILNADKRAMNRATNQITTFAERVFAVAWDQCCHAAAGVQVTPCLNTEHGT